MILTITIPDEKKEIVIKTLTRIYGRSVDTEGNPTQTEEEFIIWGFKSFLSTSIKETKKKDYGLALDNENIGL